eukprot:snap_masked-scaffold_15-processed-gene-0.12-mRNA-1 protein AED:1.00 eAED:1.00 QI:0/0/0/0/1/1/3/0/650
MELSEYERKRLKRIQENNTALLQLGININQRKSVLTAKPRVSKRISVPPRQNFLRKAKSVKQPELTAEDESSSGSDYEDEIIWSEDEIEPPATLIPNATPVTKDIPTQSSQKKKVNQKYHPLSQTAKTKFISIYSMCKNMNKICESDELQSLVSSSLPESFMKTKEVDEKFILKLSNWLFKYLPVSQSKDKNIFYNANEIASSLFQETVNQSLQSQGVQTRTLFHFDLFQVVFISVQVFVKNKWIDPPSLELNIPTSTSFTTRKKRKRNGMKNFDLVVSLAQENFPLLLFPNPYSKRTRKTIELVFNGGLNEEGDFSLEHWIQAKLFGEERSRIYEKFLLGNFKGILFEEANGFESFKKTFIKEKINLVALNKLKFLDYVDAELLDKEGARFKKGSFSQDFSLVKGFENGTYLVDLNKVEKLRTRSQWLRKGKRVKVEFLETPRKTREMDLNKLQKRKFSRQPDSKKMITLKYYSKNQVENFPQIQVEGRKIVKNSYGNVEVYTEDMVPDVLFHLSIKYYESYITSSFIAECRKKSHIYTISQTVVLKTLVKACKQLEIDYSPVVVGFQRSNVILGSFYSAKLQSRAQPMFDGLMVFMNDRDLIIDAATGLLEDELRDVQKKYEKRLIKKWEKFVKFLLLQDDLMNKYRS